MKQLLPPLVVIVQSLICVQLFTTPWAVAHQVALFSTSSQFAKFMSIELVMLSNHLILSCLLLLLASVFPIIRVFSSESTLGTRRSRYWNFSFSISPSSESSKAPQFKSISFLALNLLYVPAFTSLQDCWKNHNVDDMDLCWQSDVSAFQYTV